MRKCACGKNTIKGDICGSCRNTAKRSDPSWQEENRKRAKEYYRRTEAKRYEYYLGVKYGLRLVDYTNLLESQGYLCGICKADLTDHYRRPTVDHCHKSELVRGILCNQCNAGLGQFKDNPELMEAAASYVRRNRVATIGVDIDGCLASFESGFVPRILEVTGKDLFGDARDSPDFPPCWHYPEQFGYSPDEMTAVWKSIRHDDEFWLNLDPLPGAAEAIQRLDAARYDGNDIYFITARPGWKSKFQTEAWLMGYGMMCPTVLLSEDKVTPAILLNLDAYIDDRLKNANNLMGAIRLRRMLTRVYLKDAAYNRRDVAVFTGEQYAVTDDHRDPGLVVVDGVEEMLEKEGL